MQNSFIKSLDDVTISTHFREQMTAKGIDPHDVIAAVKNPYKVTDVRRYPGQKRFCGSGVAVVAAPEGSKWRLVTVYLDGVVTPMRPDQASDPEARRSRRLARGV